MSEKYSRGENTQRYETIITRVNSLILKYGVMASCVIISIGILAELFKLARQGVQITVSQLVKSNFGRPSVDITTILSGVINLNGIYIIEVGILILLATPILRVAVTTFVFAAEKDRAYIVIGIFVLLVLLFSVFVVGPYEASASS